MTPADLARACLARDATPDRLRKALRHIPSWAFWDATLAAMPEPRRQVWASRMGPVLTGKLGPRGAH